jgi:hypothetical protein
MRWYGFNQLAFIADTLVIAGAGILVGSLYPGQLIAQLPSGKVRHRWHILRGLTIAFIVLVSDFVLRISNV